MEFVTWTLEVEIELVEIGLVKLEVELVLNELVMEDVEMLVLVVNADGGIRSILIVEITVTVPSPKLVT